VRTACPYSSRTPALATPAYFGVQENPAPIQQGVDLPDCGTKFNKFVVINCFGSGSLQIMDSGGGVMDKMPKEGNADVLFAHLKNLGLRYAAAPHLTVRDGRLIEYSLERKRFDAAAESAEDFAQWLSRMFSLGPMEKKATRTKKVAWA
jgi:hypothetical protein